MIVDSIKETEAKTEEEFVPKAAYLEVTQDMHKYKKEFKNLQAELTKLKAQQEEAQTATLSEQQKWKELYEKEKNSRELSAKELQSKESKLLDMIKLNAVKSQIGELAKDDFVKFIPLDKVALDDNGLPDSASVKEIAEWFKKEYPMTLKKKTDTTIPPTAAQRQPTPEAKSIKNMNKQELMALYRNSIKQK